MNILKKTFRAVSAIVKNPWLLNNVLADDQVWEKYLEKKYKGSFPLPVVEIDELIPDLSETISTFSFLDGGSLPTDIALLQALCKRFSDCRYFEIGTWRGESVANVAGYAKECYTLNLGAKDLLERGMSKEYSTLHGFFSKDIVNVIHLHGNSLTYDFSALNKKFDLVFIDGDHRYEYVKNDTEKIFRHLVHENSIVAWHDYAYNPEKVRYEVLAAILDGVPPENRSKLYHVSNTMCAVYLNIDIPNKNLQVPTVPNKIFEVKLEVRKIIQP